jgi:zinc transport system substrate-binding protein
MTRPIYIIYILLATLLLTCCGKPTQPEADIIVSIEPLKYIVEEITEGDFRVDVLVPQGASPETFDPTPRQIMALDKAKMVFAVGLIDFEQALLKRVGKNNITNLSDGIELIAGTCSHAHEGHHHHGVDPHIWTSPRELKIMAHNTHKRIMQHYPDSVKYTKAYEALVQELDSLDRECERMISASSTKAFAIYHPALTYYARAYSLEQIAIEDEGKEPSAKHIARIIEQSHDKGVRCLLYQVEFPRSTADVVAKDMGIEPKEINPLASNPLQFIKDVTNAITGN